MRVDVCLEVLSFRNRPRREQAAATTRQQQQVASSKKTTTMADAVLKELALDEVAYVELLRKLISVAVRWKQKSKRWLEE